MKKNEEKNKQKHALICSQQTAIIIYICVFATLCFVLINSVPLKLLCVNLDFV